MGETQGRRYRNVVGANIRLARKAAGLTQNAFAAKVQIAGLTKIEVTALSKIENMTRSVTDYELLVMADILKVSIETLYEGVTPTKKQVEDLQIVYKMDEESE